MLMQFIWICENAKRNLGILKEHCRGVGRDYDSILKTKITLVVIDGLSEAKYEEKQERDEQQKHLEQYPVNDYKQRTISDFLN
jgi:hypothetical protein